MDLMQRCWHADPAKRPNHFGEVETQLMLIRDEMDTKTRMDRDDAMKKKKPVGSQEGQLQFQPGHTKKLTRIQSRAAI